MFKKLQDIANFLFGWIAEAIKISVLQGQNSRWNFGSYFGLTFEEFLDRITPAIQNPYWGALTGFVQGYDAPAAKKGMLISVKKRHGTSSLYILEDFEFILNCTVHASNAQLVQHTRTCLLYGSEPYTPIEKLDLAEQFENLSILT
jgi:hypothetical protein